MSIKRDDSLTTYLFAEVDTWAVMESSALVLIDGARACGVNSCGIREVVGLKREGELS